MSVGAIAIGVGTAAIGAYASNRAANRQARGQERAAETAANATLQSTEAQIEAAEAAARRGRRVLDESLTGQISRLEGGTTSAADRLNSGFRDVNRLEERGLRDFLNNLGGIESTVEGGFDDTRRNLGASLDTSNSLLTTFGGDALEALRSNLSGALATSNLGLSAAQGLQDGSNFAVVDDAIGTLQGIDADATQRRIEIASEALNRQLASRGLLDSGAGIEALGDLASDITAEEQANSFQRNALIAELGLGRSGAELDDDLSRAGLLAQTASGQGQLQAQSGQALEGAISDLGTTLSGQASAQGQALANLDLAELAQLVSLGQTGAQQELLSDNAQAARRGQLAQQLANLETGESTDVANAIAQNAIAQANAEAGAGTTVANAFGNQGRALADIALAQGQGLADIEANRLAGFNTALSGLTDVATSALNRPRTSNVQTQTQIPVGVAAPQQQTQTQIGPLTQSGSFFPQRRLGR